MLRVVVHIPIQFQRCGICDSCQATGKTPQSDTKPTHEPSYGLTSPLYGRPSDTPEPRKYHSSRTVVQTRATAVSCQTDSVGAMAANCQVSEAELFRPVSDDRVTQSNASEHSVVIRGLLHRQRAANVVCCVAKLVSYGNPVLLHP